MRKIASSVAVLVLLAAACSSDSGIAVTLDEYSITVADQLVTAGAHTFSVRDTGAIAHQLLVLRTNDRPDDLPVGKDGVVETDAKGITEVGGIDLITPGERETLSVALRPGRYALICNIAGHYSSGMHAGLTVT